MPEELSNEVLEILACTKCGSNLDYNKAQSKLVCIKCSKEFRIENGIPNMVSG
ncbi:MAG: Trm112 family protein [Candidatus Diapherotrites archaeon]